MSPTRRGAKRRATSKKNHFPIPAGADTSLGIVIPTPNQPFGACPISGKPISNIYEAIADPKTGEPCEFDSVCNLLQEQEKIGKGEQLIYIGGGRFGIIKRVKKKQNSKIEIVRVIEYEQPDKNGYKWRKDLAFHIKRDYSPESISLDTLYSPEELDSFPNFGSISLT